MRSFKVNIHRAELLVLGMEAVSDALSYGNCMLYSIDGQVACAVGAG